MAYGMITSGILGAVAGLGEAAIKKVGDINEAELKAKIDAEKEKRIEEALIRTEGRAAAREQGIYERNQAQKTIDSATERQNKYEDEQRAITNAVAKQQALDQYAQENPQAPSSQATNIDLMTKKQNIANAQLSNQKTQLEIDKLNQASDLIARYKSATTDKEREEIANEWNLTTGKGIRTKIENVTRVDVATGEYDNNGKPINRAALIDYSDPTKPKELPIEALKIPAKPYSSTEANDIAKRIMDQRYPKGRPFWSNDEYDTQLKKYSNDLQNTPKDQDVPIIDLKGKIVRNGQIVDEQPTGMLNKPTANMNANELKNSKSVYAIIANRESGSEGVNANNPKSSAGGTFQLTDETAKSYGAKADASGKIPNSEKDIAAGKFYADIEKWAGDSPTAILAAGFGQNAVKSAYEKAKANGETDFVQYLPKDSLVRDNLPEIANRAKMLLAKGAREGLSSTQLIELNNFYNKYHKG